MCHQTEDGVVDELIRYIRQFVFEQEIGNVLCGVCRGGERGGMRRKRHQARSKIILKHSSENHAKADHVQSGVFHP